MNLSKKVSSKLFLKASIAGVALLTTLSNISFARVYDAKRCEQLQEKVDAFPTTDALVQYIKLQVEDQKNLKELFICQQKNQTMPTEYSSNGIIKGDGWGSVVANSGIAGWNPLQAMVGRSIWGGKVLKQKEDGSVYLLNIMNQRRKMYFKAQVKRLYSMEDGSPAIVLDYRGDDTHMLSRFVKRVRDELREIIWRGQPSKVYIGRAYVYRFTKSDTSLNTDDWLLRKNFFFGANFFLDFRDKHQDAIPTWQLEGLDKR